MCIRDRICICNIIESKISRKARISGSSGGAGGLPIVLASCIEIDQVRLRAVEQCITNLDPFMVIASRHPITAVMLLILFDRRSWRCFQIVWKMRFYSENLCEREKSKIKYDLDVVHQGYLLELILSSSFRLEGVVSSVRAELQKRSMLRHSAGIVTATSGP